VKNSKLILGLAVLPMILIPWTAAHAQITPLADSYTNSADPTTNYGAGTLLSVDGASIASYIQFPLSSIPSGATISAATLKLYVNTVTTAGSFNVDYVNGTWSETTLTYSAAPALGGTIASNVAITAADKNQYILINVTSAVQAWLSGEQTNDGIALVADGKFNATFDSKENTTTSHPPELDIAYGDGTITGITTASGGGLIGGGTSGALNLSLTNTCASGQVLRWNGSAWACSSAGMGTITGITAGTDLTGGGTSGKVTLNLNTSALNSAYARLSAANTFTGNQTINGNLSATGVVTGSSYQIGGNLFAFGSYTNSNAFLGFAGNTTSTGTYNVATGPGALESNTTGSYNTATGVGVLLFNTTGYANTGDGNYPLFSNTTGSANTAIGAGALYDNTTGSNNTAVGSNALEYNSAGNYNTALGAGALLNNRTACCNTAVGNSALGNSTAASNDAFGYQALYSNGTGANNAAFGYQALYSNTVNGNSAFGYQALFSSVSAGGSAAFGNQALYSQTVAPNDAFGNLALFSDTTGNYNVAFGEMTLYANTTGTTNSAFGSLALLANTTGGGNVALGYVALTSNTTGSGNDALGGAALYSNTTGTENTGAGDGALYTNQSGTDLTCVGYYCSTSEDGLSNATAIGAHAVVGQSNSLVLGGTGDFAVKVGIGTTAPSNILTIGRGLGHPVSDSWETYSSRRWKTNIKTLPDALTKVERLRGVSYDQKDSGKHEIGVIAEEVGQVVPEVVSYESNGKDAAGVDYSRLTALLIEAVKQQQALIRKQQAQIVRLTSQVKTIQTGLKSRTRPGSEIEAAKAQVPVLPR
jgi:hypothetical protein